MKSLFAATLLSLVGFLHHHKPTVCEGRIAFDNSFKVRMVPAGEPIPAPYCAEYDAMVIGGR